MKREALAERHKENCACEVCRGCDNADIKAEQAEQEPVGFFKQNDEGFWFEASKYYNPKAIPLYAAPVRTKELTDDEIWEIADKLNRHLPAFHNDFARAVIQEFRRKNGIV